MFVCVVNAVNRPFLFDEMSPSAGSPVPQHYMPYEAELGASGMQLIQYVSWMEKRPSIPPHWKKKTHQV